MASSSRTAFYVKTIMIISIILTVTIGGAWFALTYEDDYLEDGLHGLVGLFASDTEIKPESLLSTLTVNEGNNAVKKGDWDFYQGDFSQAKIIGNSLPATWRPYLASSPWNMPIGDNALVHPDSDKLMKVAVEEAGYLRLVKYYNSPIWVVNSKNMPKQHVKSKKIFDTWDKDRDGWSDIAIPISSNMWSEGTEDGHMTIIDPFTMTAWEMSRFKWKETEKGLIPSCTTFNVWDLKAKGHAEPLEGKRWHQRGGRGSGFPILAGLIRPEELKNGEIRHALMFNFSKVRQSADGDKEMFVSPPASRSDGDFIGDQYLIEGMRLQLDPTLTEADFDKWGLNREAKIIARAIQKYGMYLGDSGGAMSIGIQQLAKTKWDNLKKWNELFPNLYRSVKKIPTESLRVIYTAFPREE